MSVWADIHRRSNGVQERKEDKLATQIRKLLKESIVAPDKNGPIKRFFALIQTPDNKASTYTITFTAIEHPDGSRDFYSEENVSKFMNLSDYGKILKIM